MDDKTHQNTLRVFFRPSASPNRKHILSTVMLILKQRLAESISALGE